MYASIEKLAQKMEAQLKRYKEKLKSKDQKTLNALKAGAGRIAAETEEE
jgi:ribosome-associated translation inhibitor RaiA